MISMAIVQKYVMFEYMKKYNYITNKESKPDGFDGYVSHLLQWE